jgi:hypothetical protein
MCCGRIDHDDIVRVAAVSVLVRDQDGAIVTVTVTVIIVV